MPEADYIVSPKDAQETSRVLRIANYYKNTGNYLGGEAVRRAEQFL